MKICRSSEFVFNRTEQSGIFNLINLLFIYFPSFLGLVPVVADASNRVGIHFMVVGSVPLLDGRLT